MKDKSLFNQVILLIIIAILCIIITITAAIFIGMNDTDIFRLENLNFSNVIPILLLGGFISCVIIGIAVLFLSRSAFFKVKDYFNKDNEGSN